MKRPFSHRATVASRWLHPSQVVLADIPVLLFCRHPHSLSLLKHLLEVEGGAAE